MEYRCGGWFTEQAGMRRFRPGWAPTVAVLLMLPLMVSLGFWQLDRAEEKRALLQVFAERSAAPPLAAEQLPDIAEPVYRHVRLRGRFDAAHSVLLDNSVRDGQAGVELIQPFHDQSSDLWLWVNRGWLPWPDRRQAPAFDTPGDTLNLDGRIYAPPGSTFHLQPDPASERWPRLLTSLDPPALWRQLQREGFTYEVRVMPGPAALRTDWQVVTMGPEKHVGYAVQWFAMATVLAGIYLFLGWRRKAVNSKKENARGRHADPRRHV